VFFLIEQFCVLFSTKKRVEIVKDEPNKKLTVKLINYLGMTRKTTEYDLGNLFVDVQIVDRKEGWQTPAYYRLILINTYKDGIAIDLDSSNIKNKPVSAFDFFEHVDAQKFNGQVNMKNTIQSFIGNNNEEGNPLAFNINTYMKKQDNVFKHFTNFINGITFSKYVKMNDHFFSYYSREPLKNKFCQGCLSRLLMIFHFYLFPLSFMSQFIGFENKKSSYKNDQMEFYFAAGFFGYILFTVLLYFVCIGLGSCCDKTSEFLRIDMIYSRDFDRLFIGVVNNDEKSYKSTNIFKLDEIDRFVIQKNNINEQGFHLKYITKGNGQIQDLCYINAVESDLEGLTYILNEKLNNNVNVINNNNTDTNIIVTNNMIDNNAVNNNMMTRDEDAASPLIQP
jgi:hypothetical protein